MVEADPGEDAAGSAAARALGLRYAPVVAPDPPDGVCDRHRRASAHLIGGEAALLDDLVAAARRRRASPPGPPSPTPRAPPGPSRASARADRCRRAARVDAVADLPRRGPAARRPRPSRPCAALGFERIGELVAMPTGAAGPALRHRGSAAASTRRWATRPSRSSRCCPRETPSGRLAFAEPIGAPEDLHASPRKLCADALPPISRPRRWARAGSTSSSAASTARAQALRIGTARPTRDPRHLVGLFAERLREIDPGLRHRGGDPRRQPRPSRSAARQIGRRGTSWSRRRRRARPARRPPRRPARRAAALPPRSGRERHARALRARAPPWPGCGADLARGCRARRVSRPARAHRGTALAARPSASALHLARAPPQRSPRPTGPSASTASGGADDARCSLVRDYYRVETERRRALLAVPRRAGRPGRRAGACTGSSHELRRAPGHDPLLLPARRLEPARSFSAARSCSASPALGDHRPQLASPGSCARTRPRRRPACALVVGCRLDLDGRHLPPRLPDRPRRPIAPVPPAHVGKAAPARASATSAGRTSPHGPRACSPCSSPTMPDEAPGGEPRAPARHLRRPRLLAR